MALNAKQKAFIDAYLESPQLPMSVIAARLGISENTLYAWRSRNTNGFLDEMDARLADKWQEMKYAASDGLASLIRDGDFKAIKYALDYHGYAPTTRVEANITNTININVIGEEDASDQSEY